MSEFGKFTQITFVDGTSPPINAANLNELERVVALADSELAYSQNNRFRQIKEYCWNNNCYDIELFNNTADWSSIGTCTIESESYPRSGDEDVAFQESDNSAGTIGIEQTISSIDLEYFNDNETASTTSDIITLAFYLSDKAYFDSITIKLGDDSSNYYYKTWTISGSGEDRLTYSDKKLNFSTTGTPTGWDSITYIAVEGVTAANASGEYCTLYLLGMYRNDPDNDGNPQPFQKFMGSVTGWQAIYGQESPTWLLYSDPNINEPGIQKFDDLNDVDNYDTLLVQSGVIEFLWEAVMISKDEDNTNALVWYVDSNNYAAAYYDGYYAYLDVMEAGVLTYYDLYISEGILLETRSSITLEKNGDTIRASFRSPYNPIVYLEHETTISSSADGDLYFGHYLAGNSYIVDWKISNVNDLIDDWNKPKHIIKLVDESRSNDTSMSIDAELFFSLPPFGVFEVEANIIAIADSTTPDIKIDWDIDNGTLEQVTARMCLGPSLGLTTVNTTQMVCSYYAFVSDIGYGLRSGDESFIQEKFIVKTGGLGGKGYMRWGQNTSSADDTIVKARSYLKITKIEQLMQNKNS